MGVEIFRHAEERDRFKTTGKATKESHLMSESTKTKTEKLLRIMNTGLSDCEKLEALMLDLEKTNRFLVDQVDKLTGEKVQLLNHVALLNARERIRARKLDDDLRALNVALESNVTLEEVLK